MASLIFQLKKVFVICLLLTALLAPQAQALGIKRAAAPEPQLLVPVIPGVDYPTVTVTTTALPEQTARARPDRIHPYRCWWGSGCDVPGAILPTDYNSPWLVPTTEEAGSQPTQTETRTLNKRAPEQGMYSILPVDFPTPTAPANNGMYSILPDLPIRPATTTEEATSQPTPTETPTPSRVLKQTLRAGTDDTYMQIPKNVFLTRAAEPTPKTLVTRAAEPTPKTLITRAAEPTPKTLITRAAEPTPKTLVTRAAEPTPKTLITRAAEPTPKTLVTRAAEPTPKTLITRAAEPTPKTLVTRAAEPTKKLVTRAAEPIPTLKTLVPRALEWKVNPVQHPHDKKLEGEVNPVYHPPDFKWGAVQLVAS
jgi:hypothetical protein